jgi:lipopolysaccharide export system protein LptC
MKMPVLTLLVLLLAVASSAQVGNLVPHQRLTIRDFKASGEQYTLAGEKADVVGRRAVITNMSARFLGADAPITLTTARFDFDQVARQGKTNAPIHVIGQNIQIDGIGLDLDFQTQKMHIRKQVRLRITHQNVKLLGKRTE